MARKYPDTPWALMLKKGWMMTFTKDVQIIEAGDRDQFSGKNDFYNSEIRKAKFTLRINGEEKEVSVVLKTQLDDNFHKISAKFTQPFTKEAFWYNQASKELGSIFPAIKGTFLHRL